MWWKIGRKPKADSLSTMLTVDTKDREQITILDEIAKRENKTRSGILRMIIKEGIEKHRPGNPQLTIKSFIDGKPDSLVELEARIRTSYLMYGGQKVYHVNYKMILEDLKSGGVVPKLRKNMAESIVNWLQGQGVSIYR